MLGTLLLSTANVSKIALQFLLLPILARLLGPKIFGLMSVAMSFVLFANMLAEGGMGPALVRIRNPDPDLTSTVFWLSVSIGGFLSALLCLLAWPIADRFFQPALAPVLCALSPILVISAMLPVPNAEIVRTQRLEVFAAGDLGCAIVSAVVGIVMAVRGYGIWSLVGQQLLLWITKAVWVISVTRFRPRLVMRPGQALPLWRFSANNLAANVTDFVGKSAPTLIVSGILGIAAAGHYSMGYQLTRVADMVVSSPVNMATFSAVAVAPDHRSAVTFVTTALRVLMIILAPLCAGIMLTADLAAPLLLGSKWMATAPVLAALAPGSLLVCLYGFAASALLGKGHSGGVFRLGLLASIAIAVGTFVGSHFGVTLAAVGFSLGATVLAPAYLWYLGKILSVSIARLLSASVTAIIAVAVMTVSVLFVRSEIGSLAPLMQLAISVISGVAVFTATIYCLDRRQIREDFARLRRTEKGEPRLGSPANVAQVSEL